MPCQASHHEKQNHSPLSLFFIFLSRFFFLPLKILWFVLKHRHLHRLPVNILSIHFFPCYKTPLDPCDSCLICRSMTPNTSCHSFITNLFLCSSLVILFFTTETIDHVVPPVGLENIQMTNSFQKHLETVCQTISVGFQP